MPKKTMKKQPPPSPPSFSSSSSDDESPPPPPPPSISSSKKLSAGSPAALLRKDTKPAVSRYPDDASDSKLEKTLAAAKTLETAVNEELSESEEEESTDDEASEKREENEQAVSKTFSSSDLGSDRNDENPVVGSSLKLSGCSKSVDGEKEGGESFESEEEESTADESLEDLRDEDPKENPPPQLRDSQNRDDDDDKLASKTSSSSDSGLGNEDDDIETPISKPSLEPLSNKPVDSSAQSVEKERNSGKQFAASPAQISKKKKTAVIVGAKGGREKDLFKRIWSNGDELVLLNGILEYKERYHSIPYSHAHAEFLLKSVKDSLSISVSVNQLNDKVRRMKRRYNNTATRQNLAKKSKFSDPHNAAVFDLSKKIWNSLKGESNFRENKITLEIKEEDSNKKKGGLKHFAEEYPSLYWLLKSEHANNALVLQNHIPIANAKKLEEKCKELEMIDTELNMQKIEFLSSAVKLIKDTLAKC